MAEIVNVRCLDCGYEQAAPSVFQKMNDPLKCHKCGKTRPFNDWMMPVAKHRTHTMSDKAGINGLSIWGVVFLVAALVGIPVGGPFAAALLFVVACAFFIGGKLDQSLDRIHRDLREMITRDLRRNQ